ncbi:Periplasmic pH-dependent serine endoprotease DegQ [bacterium HR30]|nr:Periplasmic pH-dependent serine endoprotease DegQ [bacterium HR30]
MGLRSVSPGRAFVLVVCFVLASVVPGQALTFVPESFSSVAKAARPVVVNIFSTRVVRVPGSTGDPVEDFFRQFFGPGLPYRAQRQQSLGSGFIISSDGFIVTNAHVVALAQQIRVRLATREEYEAKIVGVDQKTDIALLKIRPKNPLPTAKLGDSDTLEVGDWVVAVGNPFGLASTVTAGIVSAKDRVIGAGPYDDFIQTDASINPGNSGGPLLNLRGEVVGINSAILSRTGGSIGIGFAIPINLAKKVIDELRQHGRVIRGWLGVAIQDVTPDMVESFGLDRPRGALVVEVEPESPADRAGIRRGDVIVEFNGSPIEESRQLSARIAELPVGRSASLVLLRDGKERYLTVTIAESPEEAQLGGAMRGGARAWGLVLTDLTPQLAARFRIPRNVRGAMIREILPGSPADRSGLQPGDVIRQVDRTPVSSAAACERELARAGDSVLLLVQRGQASGYELLERGNDEP